VRIARQRSAIRRLRVQQGVEVAVASLGPQVADAEAGVGGQQRELAEHGQAEAGERALEVEEAADAVVADVDGEGEQRAERPGRPSAATATSRAFGGNTGSRGRVARSRISMSWASTRLVISISVSRRATSA
jgi:hypothetical protein